MVSPLTRFHSYGVALLLWFAWLHLGSPFVDVIRAASNPRPRVTCLLRAPVGPGWDRALAQIPDRPRPLLRGCSVYWSSWYGLGGEGARRWDEASLDALVDMGATGVNIQASAWVDIERTRGVFDWSLMDASVDAALRRELVIHAFMGMTPEWALPPGKRGLGELHRYPPDEKFAPDFERWCETLARRYRGKIRYYEFWNEPNGCGWIRDHCRNSGMAHTYVPWLKRWYRAMKRGDPDCVLALGGLDYHSGVREGYKYLEAVFAAGGGDAFDHVAIHPYGEPLHWKAVADTYLCLLRHGQGHKRVWVTEYGWNTEDEDKRARYVDEVLSTLSLPEFRFVSHARFVSLTDHRAGRADFGLCAADFDALQPLPRPAFHVFATHAAGSANVAKAPNTSRSNAGQESLEGR